jgi:hypothetical protein
LRERHDRLGPAADEDVRTPFIGRLRILNMSAAEVRVVRLMATGQGGAHFDTGLSFCAWH